MEGSPKIRLYLRLNSIFERMAVTVASSKVVFFALQLWNILSVWIIHFWWILIWGDIGKRRGKLWINRKIWEKLSINYTKFSYSFTKYSVKMGKIGGNMSLTSNKNICYHRLFLWAVSMKMRENYFFLEIPQLPRTPYQKLVLKKNKEMQIIEELQDLKKQRRKYWSYQVILVSFESLDSNHH